MSTHRNGLLFQVRGRQTRLLGVFAILWMFSIPSILVAQEHSTMGTDFWVSYLYFTYEGTAPQYSVTLHAFASGPRACVVSMTNSDGSWSTSFSVTPGQVTHVDVPYNVGCTPSSGVISEKAIHVTSTDTISLYLITLGHYNIDMTNALPTPSLGSNYMIQCYPSKLSTSYRSEFVIVATEDSTVVDIVPSAPTMNGFPAGSTITINLQQGETYQLRGRGTGGEADLTGSRINARDCKKIAVYSGHFCAYVPNTTNTCDHIYDQSFPVEYWGTKFAVAGTGTAFDDHVRVMALEDGCTVTKDGQYVVTLNSGRVFDFSLSASSSTALIETSTPASVYMFMGSAGTSSNGDPSMVIINPVDQLLNEITFGTYSTVYTNTHYVTIVAEADEMSNIRLDNTPVVSHYFSGTNDYKYARVQINAGSHTLKTLGTRGFIAYAFGLGLHESYGYSVGSRLRVMHNSALYCNQNRVAQGDTIDLCPQEVATFYSTIDGNIALGAWSLSGDGLGSYDTLEYQFSAPGIYHLRVHVSSIQSFDCFDSVTYECDLEVVVRVNPTYSVTHSDTIRITQLPWTYMGNTYYGSVENDTVYSHTTEGCDSLIIYSLVLLDPVRVDYYDTICAGEPYEGNGFVLSAEETQEVGDFQYSHSHDTVVETLYLTQLGIPTLRLDYGTTADSCYQIVCYTDADDILWSSTPPDPGLEGQESNSSITVCPVVPTTYRVTAFDRHHPECSASQEIQLSPISSSTEKEETLWVPNVFTPDLTINNVFRAYGTNIEEFDMYIFQRWGLLIFHSDDMAIGWDGTYKNEPCMSGTYVYLILYRNNLYPGELHKKFGSVTLLR